MLICRDGHGRPQGAVRLSAEFNGTQLKFDATDVPLNEDTFAVEVWADKAEELSFMFNLPDDQIASMRQQIIAAATTILAGYRLHGIRGDSA